MQIAKLLQSMANCHVVRSHFKEEYMQPLQSFAMMHVDDVQVRIHIVLCSGNTGQVLHWLPSMHWTLIGGERTGHNNPSCNLNPDLLIQWGHCPALKNFLDFTAMPQFQLSSVNFKQISIWTYAQAHVKFGCIVKICVDLSDVQPTLPAALCSLFVMSISNIAANFGFCYFVCRIFWWNYLNLTK